MGNPGKRRPSPAAGKTCFKAFQTEPLYDLAGVLTHYLIIRDVKLTVDGAEVWETDGGYAGFPLHLYAPEFKTLTHRGKMSILKMSSLQENKSILLGCRRILIELPEIRKRRIAIHGALDLAESINTLMGKTLQATWLGFENAEEQDESVKRASERLRKASRSMQYKVSKAEEVKTEWLQDLDSIIHLVQGMQDKTNHTGELMKELGGIQHMLDELSFQTNIASLNSIINAIRTEGRGEIFAAVAGETRKASHETQNHIVKMLEEIDTIQQTIRQAVQLFTDFKKNMNGFRKISDSVILKTGEILAHSKEQEASLQKISSLVSRIGVYTKDSRSRYRTIRMKEPELNISIKNINDILICRSGFLGPYRLERMVSLNTQRAHLERINELVILNKEVISAEDEELKNEEQDIQEAQAGIDALAAAFQQYLDAAKEAQHFIKNELSDEYETITVQGRQFKEKADQIAEALQRVDTVSRIMQRTVLFNDMLPLVANLAALMAEGKHDLTFRVLELEDLLKKLRDTIGDIDRFLEEAAQEVAEMKRIYRHMAEELNLYRKSLMDNSSVLDLLIKKSSRQHSQRENISSDLDVIAKALKANRNCADSIQLRNKELSDTINQYRAILDQRSFKHQKSEPAAPVAEAIEAKGVIVHKALPEERSIF